MNVLTLVALLAAPPDLSALSPAKQQQFQQIAREEFCSCGSPLTLAGCFELRPTCKMADHLGRIIVRGLEGGGTSDSLLSFLSERVMGPFCGAEKKVDTSLAPSKGKKDAPITVVEFADFRCGHCKHAAPEVKAALKRYGDKVRFVFMPYPLSNHPLSVQAAEAALAAHAQGKFAEMSEALFAWDLELDDQAIARVAKNVGLDMKRFQADMTAHTYKPTVLALKKQGDDAGIMGTPSFFVNGRPYDYDPEVYTLAHRFDMELDRQKGNCQ